MSTYHISKINTTISIYYAYFHSIIKYGIILGNSGKIFSINTRKSLEFWLVDVCLNRDYTCFMPSLLNLIINNREDFSKQIRLLTILKQGISTTAIDQMLTYLK